MGFYFLFFFATTEETVRVFAYFCQVFSYIKPFFKKEKITPSKCKRTALLLKT